jgi:hypothetical protein
MLDGFDELSGCFTITKTVKSFWIFVAEPGFYPGTAFEIDKPDGQRFITKTSFW